ncbi:UvrD-helicase domain-containing protein [Vibrio anguillarum]|uniref:UvrD-helicase domain-containing protein n=5 Tax=Vibrio anguillarum TaxID=55601 RepID=UPI00188D830A|nr:UvrD-helicase domain-containing protein [Vibrio anguillarum]
MSDKYSMLVLDEEIITSLTYAKLESFWFDNFYIPSSLEKTIKRIELNNVVYIISDKANRESKLLFINLNGNDLFSNIEDKKKVTVFNRILVMALFKFGHSISPTNAWRKFIGDNYFSINSGYNETRLLFQKSPPEPSHVYVFDLIDNESKSVQEYHIEEDPFLDAFLHYEDALESIPTKVEAIEDNNFGIELTQSMENYYGEDNSIKNWYDNILTSEQRLFVDKPYNAPVRLKGAAGTGKTIALAAKILRDAYYFESQEKEVNLLFITHSAINAQLVLNMIQSMDNLNLVTKFKHVKLKVASLYDFAQEILNYNLKKVIPLSTDGVEGRQMQFELFSSILKDILKEPSFSLGRLSKCTDRFKDSILNEEQRRRFILESLNEFACILDAESIFKGSPKESYYLNGRRESWLMELESENERSVILYLHELYKNELKDMNVLSMDQMIADLCRYLSSHEWNHIRDVKGYDAVFVDELHCFTKPERMIFHDLFKASKESAKLPLFMAYDINQATDDRFLYSISPNNAGNLLKSTKVGQTDLVELTRIFRYTKNIAKFLSHIDGSVPALDLASEWCTNSKLNNQKDDGSVPELRVFETDLDLVDNIFNEANRTAAKAPKKSIAILCVNAEIFDRYANKLGRIKGLFSKLTSRDEVIKPTRGRKKCIFSMPEYVAGLQFDTVYLIHLDRNSLDEENKHNGEYRRFISQVYLGASRAKERLIIASSESHRGPVELINQACNQGVLIKD